MGSAMHASTRSQNGAVLALWHEDLRALPDFSAVLQVAERELETAYRIFLGPTAVNWSHPPLEADKRSGSLFTPEVLGHVIRFNGAGFGELFAASRAQGETERIGRFGPNSWAYIPPNMTYCYVVDSGRPVRCEGMQVRIA